jgi:hypothetical protein
VDEGLEGRDWSSFITLLEQAAGVEVRPGTTKRGDQG